MSAAAVLVVDHDAPRRFKLARALYNGACAAYLRDVDRMGEARAVVKWAPRIKTLRADMARERAAAEEVRAAE